MTPPHDPDNWWDRTRCFNAYSPAQQRMVVEKGYLPFPWQPDTDDGCPRAAEVGIECKGDSFPGPRFYCRTCGLEYLASLWRTASGG